MLIFTPSPSFACVAGSQLQIPSRLHLLMHMRMAYLVNCSAVHAALIVGWEYQRTDLTARSSHSPVSLTMADVTAELRADSLFQTYLDVVGALERGQFINPAA